MGNKEFGKDFVITSNLTESRAVYTYLAAVSFTTCWMAGNSRKVARDTCKCLICEIFNVFLVNSVNMDLLEPQGSAAVVTFL